MNLKNGIFGRVDYMGVSDSIPGVCSGRAHFYSNPAITHLIRILNLSSNPWFIELGMFSTGLEQKWGSPWLIWETWLDSKNVLMHIYVRCLCVIKQISGKYVQKHEVVK